MLCRPDGASNHWVLIFYQDFAPNGAIKIP